MECRLYVAYVSLALKFISKTIAYDIHEFRNFCAWRQTNQVAFLQENLHTYRIIIAFLKEFIETFQSYI